MKISKIIIPVMVTVLLTALSLPLSAQLSINDSYMFCLGNNAPESSEGYGQPVILSEEDAKTLLPKGVSAESLFALLRAGSALDLLGYMDKYGIGESKAYVLTQKALNILLGTVSHKEETKGLSPSEKRYLAAVLKAGYEESPLPTEITLTGRSAALKRDSEGNYVSEVMKYESVMGGILRFTDLPDNVKLYTLSGDEAPYLLSGQSFYFKSDSPFDMSELTAEHMYHIPEIIVSYHENSSYSPLVTAVISREKTAKDILSLSFVKNPDTSDAEGSVKVYAITAILLLSVFAVDLYSRRQDLKFGTVRH